MTNAELRNTVATQIKSDPKAQLAIRIQRRLVESGHEAYLVGGCVRDLLLGRVPKDYDVATAAKPDEIGRLFPEALAVGAQFGVMLITEGGFSVEVATFREDGVYRDNRRPDSVRFSGLLEDAGRRDFTINAIYLEPTGGRLVDLHQGLRDLDSKTLRCVGTPTVRFREDALRLLRALRFAANLGFQIESDTFAAITSQAYLIGEISAERCRDELLSGLTGPNPVRFLDLLNDSGILNVLLPEVAALHGCEQPPEFHPEGDVYVHTRLMLELLKSNARPQLALAVLFHDIGKPATMTISDRIRFNGHAQVGAEMAEIICKRLRLSNHQTDAVCFMVRRHMDFVNVPDMRESTLRRFLASELIEDELELHRVDCLGSHKNLSTYYYALEQLERLRKDQEAETLLPRPLINGRDLISQGLTPGPDFKKILDQTLDYQLENPQAGRDECLKYALSLTVTK